MTEPSSIASEKKGKNSVPVDLANACRTCDAQCCRYIALEWDRPRSKREIDHVRWFLLHENVHVFIDPAGKWFVEFKTACRAIAPDGRCSIYEARPRICREHGENGTEECEVVGEGSPYRVRFNSAADLERYLDDKGVDWRWKPRKKAR